MVFSILFGGVSRDVCFLFSLHCLSSTSPFLLLLTNSHCVSAVCWCMVICLFVCLSSCLVGLSRCCTLDIGSRCRKESRSVCPARGDICGWLLLSSTSFCSWILSLFLNWKWLNFSSEIDQFAKNRFFYTCFYSL